jgi:hypothetical protein
MTSMAMEVPARPGTGPRGRWLLIVAAVPTLAAVAMFSVGALVQQWVAGEHGQFHALFALAFLVPALVVAVRRPAGGSSATPVVIGFAIAALAQLVEGIGGFGYGPGNGDRVNVLAEVHDLGVVISPIGLIAGALGLTLGVAQLLRSRAGLLPAIVVAAVLVVGLGFGIAKLVGM